MEIYNHLNDVLNFSIVEPQNLTAENEINGLDSSELVIKMKPQVHEV